MHWLNSFSAKGLTQKIQLHTTMNYLLYKQEVRGKEQVVILWVGNSNFVL